MTDDDRIVELTFGWGEGEVSGHSRELRVFDEARGVMEFNGSLNLPNSRTMPFAYLASTSKGTHGWRFAMLDSVEKSQSSEKDDGGWDDEEYTSCFPSTRFARRSGRSRSKSSSRPSSRPRRTPRRGCSH